MMGVGRRRVLGAIGSAIGSAIGGAGLGAASPAVAPARAGGHQPFRFLFITDAHIEPELDAAHGTAMCFRKARAIGGDFVIQGGDHVFDALGVGRARADQLLDLYDRTQQSLALPIHHAIGNHDCFGVYAKSGVDPTDPLYGKKFYQDHFGPLYYSFDHKGVHVVVLDSIGITADRDYEGRVDAAQLGWLARDLASQARDTPILVVSHIPLVTAFACYDPATSARETHHKDSVVNAPEVIALFAGRRVIGVLQGHTHINETVLWRGVPFITGGAVSGNWWHGTHLGTPEGFTVVDVRDGRLATRYETYGFRSVDRHDT